MLKFLHAADVHLDSPLRGLERYFGAPVEEIRAASRRAFENLVALAVEEEVAFVLLAGDLYDGGAMERERPGARRVGGGGEGPRRGRGRLRGAPGLAGGGRTTRRHLKAARKTGDLDRGIASAAEALVRDEEQLRLDLGRLGLWRGTPGALEALPLPGEEILRRFAEGFENLANRRRALADQLRSRRADLVETERRLDEIRRAGAVPSEEEMMAARARRDRAGFSCAAPGWRGRRWRPIPPPTSGASRRPTTSPTACAARPAGWRSRRSSWLAGTRSAGLPRSWRRTRRARWRSRRGSRRTGRPSGSPAGSLRSRRARCTPPGSPGTRSFAPAPKPSVPSAARSRPCARPGAAEARLAGAREAAAAALAALERWQEAWGEAIQGLGLDRDALPSQAVQVVEILRRAFTSLGDAAKRERRVSGIDRDLETFRASVLALSREIAPDLADRPAEQAAVQLQALLTEARRRSDRRDALDRRTRKLEEEVRDAEAGRRGMEEELARLVAEAGSADASGLEEAERRSGQLADLLRDLERAERQLLDEGEGLTLAGLAAEAGGIAADALPGRIEQLDREVLELEARIGDLREELGRGEQELRHLTGDDAAAREAERAQEILAGLKENVERYARVRLAGSVLRREIERYRAENQDPLLRRAGEHFTVLTVGSYSGLRTDFDDRDQPVLVGVRPSGRRVPIMKMSKGARDQLYLALRLATLERYLDHAANPEPIPFIVDDILVNFDDERCAATLQVLAELSAKTQVILFTHHAGHRDLAAGLKDGAGVFVRELE